jgi:hypothetical protein
VWSKVKEKLTDYLSDDIPQDNYKEGIQYSYFVMKAYFLYSKQDYTSFCFGAVFMPFQKHIEKVTGGFCLMKKILDFYLIVSFIGSL